MMVSGPSPFEWPFNLRWALLASLGLLIFPLRSSAQDRPEDTCIACHRDLVVENLARPVLEWEKSIHQRVGVGCADCHGGDPTSTELAMDPEAGFRGKPPKPQIPALCARCHADVERMRPFNIRTDQFAEYQSSVHGRRLLKEGDLKAAACTDCHGTHEIRRKDDPLSQVYHTRVPETCNRCHGDAALMGTYGIPTDQYQEYRQSYHGQILDEEIPGKNPLLVPNCATCHGIHGATPPGIQEVGLVCGTCHSTTLTFFEQSPHYQAMLTMGLPRCIDCHGNHRILYPSPAMLEGEEEGHCGSCHEATAPPIQLASTLRQLLVSMEDSLQVAVTDLASIERSGRNIEDLTGLLDETRTSVVRAGPAFHSLDPGQLTPLVQDVQARVQVVRAEVQKVIRELAIRKWALAVIMGLVVLSVVLLYLYRREVIKDWERRGQASPRR